MTIEDAIWTQYRVSLLTSNCYSQFEELASGWRVLIVSRFADNNVFQSVEVSVKTRLLCARSFRSSVYGLCKSSLRCIADVLLKV